MLRNTVVAGAVLVFGTAALCCDAARAATIEKADNAASLNVGSSWVGGVTPGSLDAAEWDATLSGSNAVTLGGNMSLGQLVVLDPGGPVTVNYDGKTLTLNGVGGMGIDMSQATQSLMLNCQVVLAGGQTWNVGAA